MGDRKSGGDAAKSYDYYATFAAVVRAGRLDIAHSLLVDGKSIWEGPIARTDMGVTNPYQIVPAESKWLREGGYIRLYWGEDTQTTADAILVGHPPYRGFAYIVFHKFLCGRERTNLPNVEFICSALPEPDASMISSTGYEDGRVNPWAVVADLLTSRHGLGLADAQLNAASFQAAHDYLAGTAGRKEMTYGAPLLTQQEEAKSFCDGLLGSFGGLLRVNDSGEFVAVQPELDPGSLSLYLQLDENDYSKAIEVDAQTWDDVPTGIALRFANALRFWKQDVMVHDDPLALALVGENRRESVDRDWVTSPEQARKLAAEWAKRTCRPLLRGTAHIRTAEILVHPAGHPDAGDRVRPGDRVRLDVDSTPGGSGSSQLCRVIDLRRGPKGGVTMRWEAEPVSPQIPFAPEYTVPETATPEPTNITVATVIPLPLSMSPDREPSVGILASRPDDMVTGADVEFDVEDGAGTFTRIGTQIGFAVRCEVNANYLETASGAIRVEILDTRDQHLALNEPGESGAENDELLLICLTTTANLIDFDGQHPVMEIMSVISSAAVSAGVYDFTVYRARQRTYQREWLAGVRCWIIPRSSLISHRHLQFRQRAIDGTQMAFHLRSFNRFSTYDGALTSYPCLFAANLLRGPVITPWADTDDEANATGEWWPATGSISDADGNLARVRLSYKRQGAIADPYVSVFDVLLEPTGTVTLDDAAEAGGLTLPTVIDFAQSSLIDLNYWVTIEAWDTDGLYSSVRRTINVPPVGGTFNLRGPRVSYDYRTRTITITHPDTVTGHIYAFTPIGDNSFDGAVSPYPGTTYYIAGSTSTITRSGAFRFWFKAIRTIPLGESEWQYLDVEDITRPVRP